MNHRDSIGTVEFGQRLTDAQTKVSATSDLLVHQMSDHLCVGIAGKDIAGISKHGPQGFMIFDNTVVHHSDIVN